MHARTVIEEIDQDTIALVLCRKSRIIMSDGGKVSEKVSTMKIYEPDKTFVLKASGPVCSKTKIYLQENGIEILSVTI